MNGKWGNTNLDSTKDLDDDDDDDDNTPKENAKVNKFDQIKTPSNVGIDVNNILCQLAMENGDMFYVFAMGFGTTRWNRCYVSRNTSSL